MSKKLLILLQLILLPGLLVSQSWLTQEEREWLGSNKDSILYLGFDPDAGMEYFRLHGKEYGFILQLSSHLSSSLGLNVIPYRGKSWGEAYEGLQTGEIAILFGANETEERKKSMIFTAPLYQVPYSLLSRQDSIIHVIGDLENHTVGFIRKDIIIDLFPEKYGRISFEYVLFPHQRDALMALEQGDISAFITSGGIVIHDYLKAFPSLREVKTLDAFTSDMTLSVRSDNPVLAGILDKYIAHYSSVLSGYIEQARYQYNFRVMELSPEEIAWIAEDGAAVIGVTKGYLPFEHMENGEFRGISAALIREISRMTGIRFIPVHEEFDILYDKALLGEVDVMNIAKTQDRTSYFHYTRPFSTERDLIYGRIESPVVEDIYGFEEATVAVIRGYWHEELLNKNTPRTKILITDSLKESMRAVLKGKADYLIENPSVMRYFIEEWEYYGIAEKGLTSYNSYLYFGIRSTEPELAAIMDKALGLIDLEKTIYQGYSEIPHSSSRRQILLQLFFIVLLLLALFLLGLFTYRQTKALVESRTAHQRAKEREELMYRDPTTGLYNRHYLYHKVEPFIHKWPYPQSVIICDLNNLKITNDQYGHAVGDTLLSIFAEVLSECFQKEDILIRQGGDEFMIIVSGKPASYALEAAKRTEEQLKTRDIPVGDAQRITPSTAWGLASRRSKSETRFEDLLVRADNRMYAHKRKSKAGL